MTVDRCITGYLGRLRRFLRTGRAFPYIALMRVMGSEHSVRRGAGSDYAPARPAPGVITRGFRLRVLVRLMVWVPIDSQTAVSYGRHWPRQTPTLRGKPRAGLEHALQCPAVAVAFRRS